MKKRMTTLLIFCGLSMAATSFASPNLPEEGLALTCGQDIKVFTQYGVYSMHPHHGVGQIANEDMELGDVAIVRGSRTVIVEKTQAAERSLGGFGKKKGFGLYEAPGMYRLDLRNTQDNYEIYLQDLRNGKTIECKRIANDCC